MHPILIPLFLFLIITGNISVYTLIFVSLLIHEAGHLVAAKVMGMRVRSCTIMPYGGELVIPGRHTSGKKERIYLALGGPAATVVILLFALSISFPGDEVVIRIQLFLLALNLLPILPLDGGQAVMAILETKGHELSTKTAMLVQSMVVLIAVVFVLVFFLPLTFPYIILALFLLIQNIAAFRFRKYESAFINLKLKELTK